MSNTDRLTEENHVLKKEKKGGKEDFGLFAVGKVIAHIFTSVVTSLWLSYAVCKLTTTINKFHLSLRDFIT